MDVMSFSGRKESGKTTLAQLCVERGYTLINFADGLKDMVCDILEIDRSCLEACKNKDVSIETTPKFKEIISTRTNITDFDLPSSFTSIRHMFQFIGSDVIRKHSPRWHINHLKKQMQKNPKVQKWCIGDCRFRNELDFIKSIGGECWFVIRPHCRHISNHASEIDLTWDMFEDVIINDGSLNALTAKWNKYMRNGIIEETPQKYDFEKYTPLSTYCAGLAFTNDNYSSLVLKKYIGNLALNPYVLENLKFSMYPNTLYLTKCLILGMIDCNAWGHVKEVRIDIPQDMIKYLHDMVHDPCVWYDNRLNVSEEWLDVELGLKKETHVNIAHLIEFHAVA